MKQNTQNYEHDVEIFRAVFVLLIWGFQVWLTLKCRIEINKTNKHNNKVNIVYAYYFAFFFFFTLLINLN